jgi:squalene-hopene/tetraprenyl-beta-curcumene cyclase
VLPFDRSSADLTAHALRAWSVWFDHVPAALQDRIRRGARHALAFLAKQQRPDGAWAPLWFGNQHAAIEENLTYGTTRVLLALSTISIPEAMQNSPCNPPAAVQWLLSVQNDDGGWGGDKHTPSSIEETALAVESLCATSNGIEIDPNRLNGAITRGLTWLSEHTNGGREFPPSPIGFYFAKLWYFEQMYPIVYTLAAVGRASRLPEQQPLRT